MTLEKEENVTPEKPPVDTGGTGVSSEVSLPKGGLPPIPPKVEELGGATYTNVVEFVPAEGSLVTEEIVCLAARQKVFNELDVKSEEDFWMAMKDEHKYLLAEKQIQQEAETAVKEFQEAKDRLFRAQQALGFLDKAKRLLDLEKIIEEQQQLSLSFRKNFGLLVKEKETTSS